MQIAQAQIATFGTNDDLCEMLQSWIDGDEFQRCNIDAVLLCPLSLPAFESLRFFFDERCTAAFVRSAALGHASSVSTFLRVLPDTVLSRTLPAPSLCQFGAAVEQAIYNGHVDTLRVLLCYARNPCFERNIVSVLNATLDFCDGRTTHMSTFAYLLSLRGKHEAFSLSETRDLLRNFLCKPPNACTTALLDLFLDYAIECFSVLEIQQAIYIATPALTRRLEKAFPNFMFQICIQNLSSQKPEWCAKLAESSLCRILSAQDSSKHPSRMILPWFVHSICTAIEKRNSNLLAWLLSRPCACIALLDDCVLKVAVQQSQSDLVALILADPRAVPFPRAIEVALQKSELFPIADQLLRDPRVIPIASFSVWQRIPERYQQSNLVISASEISIDDFNSTKCALRRAQTVRCARKEAECAGQGSEGAFHEIAARERVFAYASRLGGVSECSL